MRKLCDILLISAANLCSHREFEVCEIFSVYCRDSSKSGEMMPPSRPGYTWLVTISAIKCLFATVLCFHLPPFNQVFVTRSSQRQAGAARNGQEQPGAARSSREAARGYRPTGIPARAPLLGVFQKTLRDVLKDVHPS